MDTKRNDDDDDDVHRRCKCKKSKCLKLYCDCFSAGFYCSEACSCKECFNLRDYEDEVHESRECIEERDPLAFSPKIHSLEGGDKLMPTVQKHRKGCRCKKSMCMQQYCECYKGKVGCWNNCRCEGCKNVHGMKGGGKCDIMIGTSRIEFGLDQHEFIPQDINGGHVKSMMNPSYNSSSPDGSSNSDMMIGTSTWNSRMVPLDQHECINQFTPQDMNIQLAAGSSNCEMMIGTSDLDLPTVAELEFMNQFITPQDFNARHDDEIK